MNRYKRLSQFTKTLSVAVGIVVARVANDWLATKDFDYVVLTMIFLVVVAIVAQAMKFGVDSVLGSSRWLRRLLLGRQFVEGTWVDLVSRDEQLIFIGLMTFESDGYSLRYQGENFDTTGNPQGSFRTEMMAIDWPCLKFSGPNSPFHGSSDGPLGYGELQFVGHGREPCSYSGFFVYIHEGDRLRIVGWKIDDNKILEQLKNPSTKIKTVIDFAVNMMGLGEKARYLADAAKLEQVVEDA